MRFETEDDKREMQRWSRLAIQLIGVADTGAADHITVEAIVREIDGPDVFAYLRRELPGSVWEISKLTDVDRHKLSRMWQMCAQGFEPKQFHISRNGLLLLAAYLLHFIDIGHAIIPK